jgi:hypothetical protein
VRNDQSVRIVLADRVLFAKENEARSLEFWGSGADNSVAAHGLFLAILARLNCETVTGVLAAYCWRLAFSSY